MAEACSFIQSVSRNSSCLSVGSREHFIHDQKIISLLLHVISGCIIALNQVVEQSFAFALCGLLSINLFYLSVILLEHKLSSCLGKKPSLISLHPSEVWLDCGRLLNYTVVHVLQDAWIARTKNKVAVERWSEQNGRDAEHLLCIHKVQHSVSSISRSLAWIPGEQLPVSIPSKLL